MKKIVFLLLMISFHTSFSQIYEAGASLNILNILGDDDPTVGALLDVSVSPVKFGIVLKKNVNPRIAYRISANHLSRDLVSLNEVSVGIDFNFKKYNLLRYKESERSTPYFILEGVAALYSSPITTGRNFLLAIPVGIGYKTAITQKIVFSLEAKGRIALTDELDGLTSNSSTSDSYFYAGASVYYAFGWPKKGKVRSMF